MCVYIYVLMVYMWCVYVCACVVDVCIVCVCVCERVCVQIAGNTGNRLCCNFCCENRFPTLLQYIMVVKHHA